VPQLEYKTNPIWRRPTKNSPASHGELQGEKEQETGVQV
jgi:hypothetical protein